MADKPSIIKPRGQQLFPVFTESELHRLHPFGIIRQYFAGATVVAPGEPMDGLLFILSGTVVVTVRGASGDSQQIATYGPGAFVGELVDLCRRPTLLTVKALDALSLFVVSLEGIRAALKAAPTVAERIMHALIMRHLGLIEIECAIIIAPEPSREVARLESFLRLNGYAHRTLHGGGESVERTLIQFCNLDDSNLPVVLCPNGRLLCNPAESDLALAMGVRGTGDPDTI